MKKVLIFVLVVLIAGCSFFLGTILKKEKKCTEEVKKEEKVETTKISDDEIARELYSKYFIYPDSVGLLEKNDSMTDTKLAVVLNNLINVDFPLEAETTVEVKLNNVKDLYKKMFNEDLVAPEEEFGFNSTTPGLVYSCEIDGEKVMCDIYVEGEEFELSDIIHFLGYKQENGKVTLYVTNNAINYYEVVFKKNNSEYHFDSVKAVEWSLGE